MRYLITGGAGFIGSNLADHLAEDHDITIIDNFATGRSANVADLREHKNVTFIEGSITDLELMQEITRGVDGIFHQAAIPSVPRSVKDPLTTNEANITGTLVLLQAAQENGVRKVVTASSSSVYGDTPTLPKEEGMSPNPLSPYAVSKLADEYYGKVFYELYGIQTVFLRYFNIFGPRQDPASEYAAVIPKFITRLLDGKPPIIYGDGGQTRDFTFIRDVIQANEKAMESEATGIYNIACGKRISLNELADILMEIIGTQAEPIYEPLREGDIRDSLADISRARAAFGYEPAFTLEEGLKETVKWFVEQAKI
ncbi:MAG: NAD-dependent epimerase/dehydratase [Methanomicrobiales archaeon 53_19]|uniref:SDR family oxidoreductase n=1 Tax=Methanocalculus sp. TaxID=2004547 RepID=UPI000747845E|nr:SDR family oxidoreductase [Methanocalculus sp.]KUK69333.1 MAG: NAD-dependent epimerase/dehydratase [Methanocalculus sp. 52_23]KUL03745.1 MAG: NAD-dependent epimerase/dehydratase [Methanomicrobiales archaeon 53_19]HIJ07361.1 SDR family oxidoreductase [Methanocalculus sp.]